MLDGLPRDSHYGNAVATDLEVAESLAGRQSSREYRPSLTEWSPETELLAAILDRLADVVQVQSEEKLDYKPWPRPQTAAEILQARERARRRARVRELFYPPAQ